MNEGRNSVDILPENTGEIRVYVAQYWSAAKQRRVREYADAVPESDLAQMSPEDREKVLFYAHQNLHPSSATTCAPSACRACKSPCHSK